MGADFIEQDLQRTADGTLVVLHDETLDRTCRGVRGPVGSITLHELKRRDAGRWFNERYPQRARPEYVGLTVPTLDEVFRRYGTRADYYIETKTPESAPGMEEQLVRLIAAYGLRGAEPARLRARDPAPPPEHDSPPAHRSPSTRESAPRHAGAVVIQSFSAASLRRIRALERTLPCVQLLDAGLASRDVRARLPAIAAYATGVGPDKGSVDEALIDAAHSLGLVVHAYTVDEPDEIRDLATLGIDGLFTNFPERLTRPASP